MPTGPVPPSAKKVQELAESFGFTMSDADADLYSEMMAGTLNSYRRLDNDNTVRYHGLSLQIPPARHRHHYVKARVRVHEYPDGTLALFHGPRCLARYNADGEPIDSQTRQAA